MKRKPFAVSIGRTAVGKLGLFCTQRYQAQQQTPVHTEVDERQLLAQVGTGEKSQQDRMLPLHVEASRAEQKQRKTPAVKKSQQVARKQGSSGAVEDVC